MILFVCSQGKKRSRTAEVLALMGGVQARCCGTDADALAPITNGLLLAADTIICMEQVHARKVREYMGAEGKVVFSLGIADEWEPFEPLLIERLISFVRHRMDNVELAEALAVGAERLQILGLNFFGGNNDVANSFP